MILKLIMKIQMMSSQRNLNPIRIRTSLTKRKVDSNYQRLKKEKTEKDNSIRKNKDRKNSSEANQRCQFKQLQQPI